MVGRRVAKIKFIFHLETKLYFFFFFLNERVCARESSPVQMQENLLNQFLLKNPPNYFTLVQFPELWR